MRKLSWVRFSGLPPWYARVYGAWLLALAGVGVGVGLAGAARAAPLSDPTRPASEWLAAQPPVPGAVAAQPPVPGAVAAQDVTAAPRVRVLVIGRARKFAIIDGQVVRYGETYNGSKLVGINPDGVVMQKDGSKEKLSMHPAVEKRVKSHKPLVGKGDSGKNMLHGEGQ